MLSQAEAATAQVRYAAALSALTDRVLAAVRRLIGAALVADSPDLVAVEAALVGVLSGSAGIGFELATAHLSTVIGEAVAVKPAVERVTREAVTDIMRTVRAASGSAPEVVSQALDEVAAKASEVVFQSAGEGSVAYQEAAAYEIRFWKRVTSPGETCGLCVQAADRVYKRADLAPIHAHCRCTVAPLVDGETIRDVKSRSQDLFDQVDAELADRNARLGKPRTANKSRSRSKNVRVTTPAP